MPVASSTRRTARDLGTATRDTVVSELHRVSESAPPGELVAPRLFTGWIWTALTRHPEQVSLGLLPHGPSALPGPPCPFRRRSLRVNHLAVVPRLRQQVQQLSGPPMPGLRPSITHSRRRHQEAAAPASCPIVSLDRPSPSRLPPERPAAGLDGPSRRARPRTGILFAFLYDPMQFAGAVLQVAHPPPGPAPLQRFRAKRGIGPDPGMAPVIAWTIFAIEA